MSGKDAIIEKILSDAKAQAERIISDARDKAERSVAQVRADADAAVAAEVKAAETSRFDIEKRKVTVANLEVRKIKLQARQNAIEDAFASAGKALISLSEEKYKALIYGMLKAEAKDGDTVTAAAKDKAVITEAFIKDAAAKLKINLKLNAKYGDFTGGIILSGSASYDKNLTFDVELKLLREEMEHEANAIIFGEAK